jgi:hypothetical protein
MRPNQLARFLRAFGATSQPLRDGGVVFRGYPRDRLDDAIGTLFAHPRLPRILRVTPLQS